MRSDNNGTVSAKNLPCGNVIQYVRGDTHYARFRCREFGLLFHVLTKLDEYYRKCLNLSNVLCSQAKDRLSKPCDLGS